MTAVDTYEVRKVLVAAMKADAALSALIQGRVRDRRDQNTEFPYIAIGPAINRDDRDQDGDGVEYTLELEAFSQKDGFAECSLIRKAVRELFDRQHLTVPGLASCIVFDDGGSDVLDSDTENRRGVQQLRIMCRT